MTFLPEGRASTSRPVSSRSSGSVRRSCPSPPGKRASNRSVKWLDTSAKAAANTDTISSSTDRMTFLRSLRVERMSSNCSWRNSWRSRRPSNSAKASGLTGPINFSSRSRSAIRLAAVTPSSSSGHGASRAASGSRSNSARIDSVRLSRRKRVSARSISSLDWCSRASRRTVSAVERSRRRPSRRAATARTRSDCRRR